MLYINLSSSNFFCLFIGISNKFSSICEVVFEALDEAFFVILSSLYDPATASAILLPI